MRFVEQPLPPVRSSDERWNSLFLLRTSNPWSIRRDTLFWTWLAVPVLVDHLGFLDLWKMSGKEDNVGSLATGSRVQQFRLPLRGRALSVGPASAWRPAHIRSQVLGPALQIFGTLSPKAECRQTADWAKTYRHRARHGLRMSTLAPRSSTARISKGNGPAASLNPFPTSFTNCGDAEGLDWPDGPGSSQLRIEISNSTS
jgi:hypothetical protein